MDERVRMGGTIKQGTTMVNSRISHLLAAQETFSMKGIFSQSMPPSSRQAPQALSSWVVSTAETKPTRQSLI